MTTMAENERLAVLEHQYTQLQTDVSEIKSDVKALVAAHGSLATALAVREASDAQEREMQSAAGVWVRMFLPLIFAALAAAAAIYHVFFEGG